jgi:hypothetical protein
MERFGLGRFLGNDEVNWNTDDTDLNGYLQIYCLALQDYKIKIKSKNIGVIDKKNGVF